MTTPVLNSEIPLQENSVEMMTVNICGLFAI